jgi:hypothetical protein
MTALERYIRLEALGLWRESPDAEPLEVVVSFGVATLVLTDLDDNPLGHWALAGVQAIGKDGRATVYAMTPDGGETLTIRDRDMVEAIATVSRAYSVPRLPRRRRWRRWLAFAALAAALALAALLVPRLITAQAARMVPPEVADELGDRMLIAVMEARGRPCDTPAARRLLADLAAAVDPAAPPRLRILHLGPSAVALPGRTVLLDRDAAATPNGPPQIAGRVSAALRKEPVAAMMRAAGPLAGLRYILTGALSEAALARATAAALASPGGIDDAWATEDPSLPSDGDWVAMLDACP